MLRMKKWGLGFLFLLLVSFNISTSAAAVLPAETFLPEPGLRIFVTGILGSDGTRYSSTLVTAYMGAEASVAIAEETLTYFEHKQPAMDAAKYRTVWKYVATAEGIEKIPLVSARGHKPSFWLPKEPAVGVTWKAAWGNRREVMEKDVAVETPAGLFEGCIMVEYDVYAGGTGIERHYFSPGIGLVRIVSLKGPKATTGTTWYEVQKIERIDPNQARQIVEKLIAP